jgi:predicted outer membrane repeat protein
MGEPDGYGVGDLVERAEVPEMRLRAAGAGLVLALMAGLCVGFAGPAGAGAAGPFNVDNAADGAANAANCITPVAGQCRLRDAFAAATAAPGDAQINIPASLGPITLTTGNVLTYGGSHNLTVSGVGGNVTIAQTSGATQGVIAFTPGSGLLTLQNLTITGGNSAGSGGGIESEGNVTLTNSTVSGNHSGSSGGGIDANTVTLTNSTVSNNNAADGNGGGIDSGSVVLTNSTVSGNTAAENGGGIDTGDMTATNSTISGNTAGATSNGGGIDADIVTFVYVTMVQNIGSTGSNLGVGSLTSFGSVIAEPQGGGVNCDLGTSASQGFNFTDDASAAVSCKFNAATDHVGASNNPLLGALANNGGPTQTMLPQDGPSPLIDAIPSGSCQAGGASGITTDQRGLPRPDSASPNCDIGAVEVQPSAPTTLVVTAAFTG